MLTRRRCLLALPSAVMAAAQGMQSSVQVTGSTESLTLTAHVLAKMTRDPVRTTSNGMETVYKGASLYQVQDGRRVVFSLAELDPAFIDNQVRPADTGNGKPLSGAQGRLRIVAAKEKPGARSIRMLPKLEVVQLRK